MPISSKLAPCNCIASLQPARLLRIPFGGQVPSTDLKELLVARSS
jgi:hypothetical protein